MNKKVNVFIDLLILITIVLLFVFLIGKPELRPSLSSLLLIIIGILVACSRKYKDILLTARFLYWLSCNVAFPRLRNNHFIWGVFFILIAVFSYFFTNDYKESAIKNSNQLLGNNEGWYKDPLFWIVLLIIIIYGIYRLKINKKKSRK